MTEEAKMTIDAMKQAFDVFEKMELPVEERKCTLEYSSVMALISAFEQVTRERDAAVEDLEAHRPCDACGYYELQGYDCMRCRRYTDRPMWRWRGVEVAHDRT